MRTTFLLCFIFAFTHINAQTKQTNNIGSDKRLALVIGNGKYINSGELYNPTNDSKAMKAALMKVGFEVLEYENLNQSQLKAAIDDFGKKLKNYGIGLFFYAGHGIQAKGFNYLIPVDANLQSEQQVDYDCVQADRVLGLMEAAGSKVNIVILDACRNNPFERSWSRSTNGNGLAFMNAPSGSLIAYATSPGRTASDGSGSNGLYTSALLENINTPNITILQMFQNVRRTVSEKSYKQQIPWESTSLTADFYFVNSTSGSNQNSYSYTITNPVKNNPTIKDKTTKDIPNNNYTTKTKPAGTASSSISTSSSLASATWKRQGNNYWFYYNNTEIASRLKSAWSDKDLLVYDPVGNTTFLLNDFNNQLENKICVAQTLGAKENTFWRRKNESFWLYSMGELIGERTKSVWMDNDVLVYDETTNTTYILKDYGTRTDNQLRPAVLFDNAESVFWRKQDKSYWLYAKGEEIQGRTKSGWVDDNLLVYDSKTNTTYLLTNYANATNLLLQPAKVLSYIDNVFWRKKDKNYWFYVNGEQVASRTSSSWNGNDLYVIDTSTNITYILDDYANATENVLRPATKLGSH